MAFYSYCKRRSFGYSLLSAGCSALPSIPRRERGFGVLFAFGFGIFQIVGAIREPVAVFQLLEDSNGLVVEKISAFLITCLRAEWCWLHPVAKQCEDLVDLVETKRCLALLQFADKSQAQSRTIREIALSKAQRPPLGFYKLNQWAFHGVLPFGYKSSRLPITIPERG